MVACALGVLKGSHMRIIVRGGSETEADFSARQTSLDICTMGMSEIESATQRSQRLCMKQCV